MSFLTWVLVGLGLFVLYEAVHGNNPIVSAATHLGFTAASSPKLKTS